MPRILAIVLAGVILFASASAEVPRTMNYQGRLTGNTGEPLDTTVSMTFAIYDDSTGGTAKWMETQSSVKVDSGLFSVILGTTVPIDDSVFSGPDRFLGIQVGADPEMYPRTRLVSVPYSYRAKTADSAAIADDGDWTTSGADIHRLDGNVGIGTASPVSPLTVQGGLSLEMTNNDPALVYHKGGLRRFGTYVNFEDSWRVARYDDAGSYVNSPLQIDRQTGNLNLGPNQLYVDATNSRIGIGTITPSYRFTLEGDDVVASLGSNTSCVKLANNAEAFLGGYQTLGGQTTTYLANNTFYTSAGGWTRPNGENATACLLLQNGGIALYTGTTDLGDNRMVILNNGNVGIGTDQPGTRLHVVSNAGTMRLEGTDHTYLEFYPQGPSARGGYIGYRSAFNPALTLRNELVDGNINFSLSGAGKVGIGTSSPTSMLTVAGSVTATTYYGDGSNLTGIVPQPDNDWTITGSNMYSAVSGNVGIGTTSPDAPLEIRKEVGGATTLFKVSGYEGDQNSVWVRSNGNLFEIDHHGYNTSQKALYVNHDGSGYGAYILGTTYIGGDVGIGTSSPSNKLDVRETGTSAAVYAESQSIASNIGAVTGRAKAQGGSGVYGETWESGAPGLGSSIGVFGWAAHQGSTTGGGCIGVMGKTDAYRGSGAEVPMGVYGEAMHTTGVCWGVAGETRSTHADAVGVKGTLLTATSSGKAVLGVGGSPGWAGYFQGDVNVTGDIFKSGSGFKIDHPLDPANRFLQHSSVESPDMKNVYDGTVILDSGGEATVTLPDYFESLNSDFRYQLTCIGGYAPVYIAEEIQDGRFKIAGGTLGLKVSWQVTGIRMDAYAYANRIQVESDKPERYHGLYLHPDAFGVDTSLAIR